MVDLARMVRIRAAAATVIREVVRIVEAEADQGAVREAGRAVGVAVDPMEAEAEVAAEAEAEAQVAAEAAVEVEAEAALMVATAVAAVAVVPTADHQLRMVRTRTVGAHRTVAPARMDLPVGATAVRQAQEVARRAGADPQATAEAAVEAGPLLLLFRTGTRSLPISPQVRSAHPAVEAAAQQPVDQAALSSLVVRLLAGS